ncbi:hypothetical protein [Pseudonocardia xishanensis]|uniref:Alkylhydroperoxidase family enzyme n=1 Tax=Pseudonocardia xishanensis TaxID=630995 RepID=A0ABP8S2E5_9PSEU
MPFPNRIPPAEPDQLDERQQQVRTKMGPHGEEGASAMMRTFWHYPEFARSIGRIGTRVTLTNDLGPRLAVLAALRTAWLCDGEYVWSEARAEALIRGLTDAEITAVATASYDSVLTSVETHVVEAVDELHFTHHLTEEKWYRIDRLGPNALLDLMTTYSFILTLCAATNSMGVQLEPGSTGWGLRREALVADGAGHQASRVVPQRVFEVDYTLLSPRQTEQASRMGRRGKPSTSKLQKAMMNYPTFLAAMAPFGKRAIDDTCLPVRVWQIACMRTVWRCDSEYLWSQHRKAGLKIGITDEELLGVAEGPDSTHLQDLDRVVVSAVDEMYDGNRISDANWERFDQFGREGITDLILVYGLYVLQSCVARNFGTTLEPDSIGYLPELQRLRDRQQRAGVKLGE